MNASRSLRTILIVLAALAIAVLASRSKFLALTPNDDLKAFGSLLATLFFASAILERALDVWLSLVMGGEADRLDGEIRAQKTKIEGSADETKAVEEKALAKLLAERAAHQGKTRTLALPVAMIAGVVISAVGLRSLEPLFLKATGPQPQDRLFGILDICVTGTLLAGGSDGIHWIIALYRDWMDKNRSTKS